MGKYDDMKKPELQAEARSRGLDDSGTVDELRERLIGVLGVPLEAEAAEPVRGDDGLGNTRPADDRFAERAKVDDRSDQVPVAPGSSATMKPILDADGELYPSAANDLPNAGEIKARLERERDERRERAAAAEEARQKAQGAK
jgi:hypothetical protein